MTVLRFIRLLCPGERVIAASWIDHHADGLARLHRATLGLAEDIRLHDKSAPVTAAWLRREIATLYRETDALRRQQATERQAS